MANQNTPNFIFNKSRFSHLRSSEDLLNVTDLSRSFVFAEQLLSSQVPPLSATSLTESNLNSLNLNSGTPEFTSVASTNTDQGHIFQCRSIKLTKRSGSNPAMYEVSTSPAQNLAGTTPALPVDLNKIIENYDNYTFRVFSDAQIDLSNCPFTFVVRAGHLICLADGVPNNTSAMIKNIGNTTNADTLYMNCYIYNGNVGTNQFLGYTGPQGATGSSGSDGVTGPQGATGAGFNMTSYSSHLIPSQNATYDIGSAEYKVRHLFLSDNSLWLGDEHKITISSGEMKFRRRNKNRVPQAIADVDGGQTTSASNVEGYFPGKSVEQLTLKDWDLYAQTKGLTFEELFQDDEDDFDRSHESGGATGPIGVQGSTGAAGTVSGGSKSIGLFGGSYYWGSDTSTTYPTVEFIKGFTYTISINNLSGHPVRLQTENAISNSNLYNDGLSHSDGTIGSSAQNKTTGTWTWSVPINAPNTLYYRCQYHSGMIGTITTVEPSIGLKGSTGPAASNYWTSSTGNVYRSSGKVGVATTTPNESLEVSGNILIDNGNSSVSTQGGRLLFDNAFGKGGPNKIRLQGESYGFGVDTSTMKYLTGGTDHKWWYSSSGTNNGTLGMTLSSSNLTVAGSVSASSFNGDGSSLTSLAWSNLTGLPTASTSTLGLIKIGYTESGKNYPVELDANNKAYVNVPWIDTDTDTNTTYSTATSSTLGLIKIGYTESGKNYPVELDGNNKAYVNVPWTNTDTNSWSTSGNNYTTGKLTIGDTSDSVTGNKINVQGGDNLSFSIRAGNAAMGNVVGGWNAFAFFGYHSMMDVSNFALAQTNGGQTKINSKAGTSIQFTNGGASASDSMYYKGGKLGIGADPHTKLEIKGGPLCFHSSIYDDTATPSNGVEQEFIAFGGISGSDKIEYGMYMGLRKTEAVTSGASVRLQIGQLGSYDTTKATEHADNTDQFTPRVTIMRSGNVGIGTNDPSTYGNLAVTPSGAYYGITLEKADQTVLWKVARNDDDSAYIHFYNGGTSNIHFDSKTGENSYINNGGNVGIGTTTPGALLQIGSGYKVGDQNSKTLTARGWYRIAQVGTQETATNGTAIRSGAVFTLRDNTGGGGHSHLKMIVGMSFGEEGTASLTVLSHSYYFTRTFTQARLVHKAVYDAIYLEVYVHSSKTDSIPVSYVIENNAHTNDWIPVNWTAGSIPSGFSSNTYSLEVNFSVCSDTQDFVVSNEGRVGIGTTAGSHEILDISGWIGRTSHHNGALCGGYNNIGLPNRAIASSPIYVIGSDYKPKETSLDNMYGIGYTHSSAGFITEGGASSWGQYVAADGDARIWFGAAAGGNSYFNTTGGVGIGNNDPGSYKLSVTGTAYVTSTLRVNGNVGIGNSPSGSYKLKVYGSGWFYGGEDNNNYDFDAAVFGTDPTNGRGLVIRTNVNTVPIGSNSGNASIYTSWNATDGYGSIVLQPRPQANSALIFKTCEDGTISNMTERMRINSAGRVGIGDSNPGLPLVVRGYVAVTTGAQYTQTTTPLGGEDDISYYNSNQSSTNNYSFMDSRNASVSRTEQGFHIFSNWRFTAFFEYGIFTGGIIVSSDERIKTEITDLSDNYALELVRNIPCREYHYKDIFSRENQKTVGFIAQEVKEVYPNAVKIIKNYIPDQQKIFDNLIWEENYDSSENLNSYLLTIPDYDVSLNTNVKFACSDNYDPSINYFAEDNTENIIYEEIISTKREDGKFLFEKIWNYVAVIAKEVNDFHSLDKQKIFALHHPAIQELDRQQQADKIEIAALKTQVSTLETQLANVLTRLSALENQ